MKALSIILMICCWLGCYNTLIVNQKDEIRKNLEEKEGVHKLTTQSSETYSFLNHEYMYVFNNDTIYGRARKKTSDPRKKFEAIQFSLNEISTIEIQGMDALR